MTVVAPLAILWIVGLVLAPLDGRQRWVGWLGLGALIAACLASVVLTLKVLASGPVEVVAGNWPVGVGIALRADPLGLAFAVTALAVIAIAYGYEFAGGIESRSFPALGLFLAVGLTGVFLTGDAFNFYVFFEIAMVASYILTAYGEERRQLRAAVIFAVVNLLGSVLFLIGIVSLYHVTGSLDMGQIAARMPIVEQNPAIVAGVLIFVALSVKLGLFPFHFWLPAVYTGVHPSVAAMLSGALASIGAYGVLRFGAGMLPRELELARTALIVLGIASIAYGGIQAVARHDPAEVIAYSAIGQVGYILIAVAVGGGIGFAAAVLFSMLNSFNKTLLFLASDQMSRTGSIAFAIGGLSVAGIPIAAGFWGKAALIRTGIAAEGEGMQVVLTAAILGGGLISVVYMFQSFGRAYWHTDSRPANRKQLMQTLIVVSAAVLSLLIGIWPEPLLSLSEHAAAVLPWTTR